MEIRRWLLFLLVKCVIVQYIGAKTVSLNEIIAAESQGRKQEEGKPPTRRLTVPDSEEKPVSEKNIVTTESTIKLRSKRPLLLRTRVSDSKEEPVSEKNIVTAESKTKLRSKSPLLQKIKDLGTETVSLNKINTAKSKLKQLAKRPLLDKIRGFRDLPKLSSLSKRLASQSNIRRFKTEDAISGIKTISPLRYRKEFQIKSPLKPKKLKLALTSRHKRKNQARKREITGNESLKHKYIPLLKSLSMLFDNILGSDESESYEVKRKRYKHRHYFEEQFEEPYIPNIPNAGTTKPKPQKKTTTPSPPVSAEISTDSESLTSHEDYDYSTNRPHKDIPILLPRNPVSVRRDDHGSSERSSAAYNGDLEGDITGDHGDNEYNTGCAENETCAASDKNNTYSITRNDASSIRHSGTSGNGNNTRNSEGRQTGISNSTSTIENENDTTGTDQFEIGGNKTESEDSIPEPVRKLRGSVSENKIAHDEGLIPGLLQSKEVREESILNATYDSTSDKRITNEDGTLPTEDEKIRRGNETMISVEWNTRHTGNNTKSAENKRPVLLIFDGYSVTRDKNGENNVSGKSIHIRS